MVGFSIVMFAFRGVSRGQYNSTYFGVKRTYSETHLYIYTAIRRGCQITPIYKDLFGAHLVKGDRDP